MHIVAAAYSDRGISMSRTLGVFTSPERAQECAEQAATALPGDSYGGWAVTVTAAALDRVYNEDLLPPRAPSVGSPQCPILHVHAGELAA